MARCRVCGRSAGLFFHLCPEHRSAPGEQRPQETDAPTYLAFLTEAYEAYGRVASYHQLLSRASLVDLVDVTERPDYQAMEAANLLAPGFDRRVYEFQEPGVGKVVTDICFMGSRLVNVRAQLFFADAPTPAVPLRFLAEKLVPCLSGLLGPSNQRDADFYVFRSAGVVAAARYVTGSASVSAWLTDERYA